MQILYLDTFETIILDIMAWVFFHLSIGFWSSKMPLEWLNPDRPFFKTFSWEKDGTIYERLFHVRAWKMFIPNGSRLYPGAFSIRRLNSNDAEYLQRWLRESVRSEICHWMMIFPGFLFFLWNNVLVSWMMVAYAFLNNLIPIILQRFNRPRMRKMLAILERSNQQKSEPVSVYIPQKTLSDTYK